MALTDDLKELVAFELRELSWRNNYSLNPSAALWSFFEGFRETQNTVLVDDKEKTARIISIRPFYGRQETFKTTLTFDEILKGWEHSPKNSPHSLYDSICMAYDRMGEHFKSVEDRNKWFEIRDSSSKDVRRKMDEILLDFFAKYQENMLLPANLIIPELKEPVLFDKVLKEFPMHILEKATECSRRGYLSRCGPCAETLTENDFDFNELDIETYYPTEETMKDYFWGLYLQKLAEDKKYPLEDRDENSLRSLVSIGGEALKRGDYIWDNR